LTKIDEVTKDPILITASKQYAQSITKIPFTHELTSAEKRRAEKEYHDEKRMNAANRSRFHPSRS
jgi:hypothetical protein